MLIYCHKFIQFTNKNGSLSFRYKRSKFNFTDLDQAYSDVFERHLTHNFFSYETRIGKGHIQHSVMYFKHSCPET